MNRRRIILIACLSTLACVGATSLEPPTDARADDPQGIDLTVTDTALTWTDPDGGAITVKSDVQTDGLRTVRGVLSSGDPVLITEYFAPPVPDGADALQTDQATGNDPTNYTVNSDFSSNKGATAVTSETGASTLLDPSTMDPTFATAVTPTTVTVAWPEDAPDQSPSTTQARTSKARVATHNKHYTKLKPNSRHTYTVATTNARGEVVTRTIPIQTLVAKAAKKTMKPNSLPGDGGSSQGAMQSTAFIHKAFIPDNLVDMDVLVASGCGKFLQNGYQFHGDDRSWQTPSSADPSSSTDFRTLMYAKVKWTSGAADISTIKRVQPTRVYYKGKPNESRTASMSDMYFQDIERGNAYAQVRFNHSSGNPFCAAGAITYNEIVRFYRNGALEVVGSRYPVPRHEGYGQWDRVGTDPVWHTEFRMDNKGFGCLTGACGRDTINYSKSY